MNKFRGAYITESKAFLMSLFQKAKQAPNKVSSVTIKCMYHFKGKWSTLLLLFNQKKYASIQQIAHDDLAELWMAHHQLDNLSYSLPP